MRHDSLKKGMDDMVQAILPESVQVDDSNADFNPKLSKKWSAIVAKYFMTKGVPGSRIRTSNGVYTRIEGVPCAEKELEGNRLADFRFCRV